MLIRYDAPLASSTIHGGPGCDVIFTIKPGGVESPGEEDSPTTVPQRPTAPVVRPGTGAYRETTPDWTNVAEAEPEPELSTKRANTGT